MGRVPGAGSSRGRRGRRGPFSGLRGRADHGVDDLHGQGRDCPAACGLARPTSVGPPEACGRLRRPRRRWPPRYRTVPVYGVADTLPLDASARTARNYGYWGMLVKRTAHRALPPGSWPAGPGRPSFASWSAGLGRPASTSSLPARGPTGWKCARPRPRRSSATTGLPGSRWARCSSPQPEEALVESQPFENNKISKGELHAGSRCRQAKGGHVLNSHGALTGKFLPQWRDISFLERCTSNAKEAIPRIARL